MTLWSRHRFVPDEELPRTCAHCGRRADVHKPPADTLAAWQTGLAPNTCTHCGAPVTAAAGACFKCGELQ